MSVLPPWLDTADPEARRGTSRVRAVEPFWVCGRNRKTAEMEVWGQGKDGAWVPIAILLGANGRPCLRPEGGDWDRFLIAQAEARRAFERTGETSADRVLAHNQRLDREQRARELRHVDEAARYAAKAVAREVSGDSPYEPRDVIQGWFNATEGGAKVPGRNRRAFVPGIQPATGGHGDSPTEEQLKFVPPEM